MSRLWEEKKKKKHPCQLGKVRFMVCMSIFKSSLVSRKSALIPSERFFFVVYVCASGRGLAGESSYRVDGQAGSASLCLFSWIFGELLRSLCWRIGITGFRSTNSMGGGVFSFGGLNFLFVAGIQGSVDLFRVGFFGTFEVLGGLEMGCFRTISIATGCWGVLCVCRWPRISNNWAACSLMAFSRSRIS